MKLTTISITVKRFFWVIPLLVVALILSIVIVFQFSQSKKEKLAPRAPIAGLPGNAKVFELGKNAEVESVQSLTLPRASLVDLKSKSAQLAAKLGFTTPPEKRVDARKGEALVYQGINKNLIIYEHQVEYASSEQPSKNILDEPTLRLKALNFIKSLLEPSLALDENTKGTYVSMQKGAEGQGIYNFSFSYLVDNAALVPASVKIQMTSGGDILAFSFSEISYTSGKTTVKLLNIDESLKTLTSGKGTLIEMSEVLEGQANIENIDRVNIERARTGYYFNQTTPDTTLQPVWIFYGEASVSHTKPKVTFIVPATKN